MMNSFTIGRVANVFADICNKHPEFLEKMKEISSKFETEESKVQETVKEPVDRRPLYQKTIEDVRDNIKELHDKRVAASSNEFGDVNAVANHIRTVAESSHDNEGLTDV